MERYLRRHLELEARPRNPATARRAHDAAFLQRRWHHLRRAAEDLGGADSHSLLDKLQSVEPLLRAVEAVEGGAGSAAPMAAPWARPELDGALSLTASDHGACATAREVGEGRVVSTLGTGLGQAGASELWLRHRAGKSGTFGVSTAGSSFDTVLEIYSGCPASGGRLIRAGDDEVGLQARTGFSAAAGQSRWILVRGWEGAEGFLAVELRGSITVLAGTVIREATSSPLQSERVEIWDAGGSFAASDSTDSNGEYLAFGLAPGTYFVSTDVGSSAPVFDELYDDLPCVGGAPAGCTPTDGTPVVLIAGEITSGIDFALGDGGTVSGRVRDAQTGAALPSFRVELYSGTGSFLGSTATDVGGRYRREGLGGGTVFAWVDGRGPSGVDYQDQLFQGLPCPPGCDPTLGTPIPVQPGERTSGIDFALVPLGSIEGTLTDSISGAPLAFEQVNVYDAAGSFAQARSTDSAGRYRVGGLETGDYFVLTRAFNDYSDELYDDLPCEPFCDPTDGTPVAVTTSQTTSGIDFELVRTGRLSGTVVDADSGLALGNARVQLFDAGGNPIATDFVGFSGMYAFSGLGAGTYYLVARESSHLDELYDDLPCPSTCDVTSGTAVAIEVGQDTEDIDFALVPLGAIEGTVTESGSGDPVTTFLVRLWSDTGSFFAGGSFVAGDGAFRFEGIADGTYFATVHSNAHFAELYDDLPCPGGPPTGCDPTTGTSIPVSLGTTTSGIDFELDPLGSISGLVRAAADGSGVDSATVLAFNSSGGFIQSVGSDSSGAFRIRGLEEGTYFLLARASRFGTRLYDDLPCPASRCDPTTGTAVTVSAGIETSGIDFDLPRKGVISGTVTAETGQPLFSINVSIYDLDGNFITGGFADSPYFLEFEPGTWLVVAEGFSGFFPELYDGISCGSSGCDLTRGTPVEVIPGGVTEGIDFELDVARGIVGRVTDGRTGLPMAGVAVDLWSSSGSRLGAASTGARGFYRFDPGSGTFFVSTDNGLGAQDEIWDDVQCPDGSAFDGLCDPLTGDPVILGSFGDLVSGIDFELIVVEVFADGFESGDVSAWSASLP